MLTRLRVLTVAWRWLLAGSLLASFSLIAAGRERAQSAPLPARPGAPAGTHSPQVFAHFAESPGSATDLTINAYFAAGLAGIPSSGGAQLDLYLFTGAAGTLLKSATNVDICNPCSFAFTIAARSATFSLESAILAHGGFPAANNGSLEGYGVIVIFGADPDNLAVQVIQKESSASYELPLAPLADSNVSSVAHFTEAPGALTDFLVYLSYAGGQGSLPPGAGAMADIYILTNTGQPLKSGTNLDVCNPCTYSLTSVRHQIFKLEAEILARGGFPAGAPAAGLGGAAIVVISGPDPLGLSRLAVQHSPYAIDYLPLVRR